MLVDIKKISQINVYQLLFDYIILFAVRAGTGGDEAGIWAGDLVGTYLFSSFLYLSHVSKTILFESECLVLVMKLIKDCVTSLLLHAIVIFLKMLCLDKLMK